MRKSIVVALGGAVTALMAACGTNGEGGNQNPTPSASTTTTVPDPAVPPTTPGTPGTTPGVTTPPGTPPPPVTPPPTPTGGSGGTGTTSGGSGDSGPSGGSEGTDTSEAPAASTEGETTSEPPGPVGPPPGAYEPCSGAEFPKVVLTEFLLAGPGGKVTAPIDMDFPRKQPNTVYVTERGGKLKRFALDESGVVTGNATEILSVTTSTANECGYLATAFHPDFDGDAEKRVYVSYMPACPTSIFGAGGKSALDIYEVSADGTAVKVESILELDQPQGNHNGGNVVFGPDGYLYFGLGDGGNGDDTGGGHNPQIGNGQDVSEPLGSILRFDVDNLGTPPAGNLTAGDVGGGNVDGRILHYGLRNPWRFSFDRVTGDLWIGDVGQAAREEVNMIPKDSGPTNLGWPVREGKQAHSGFDTLTGAAAHEPIYDYPNRDGAGMAGVSAGSVTGGFVYRGQKIPGMYGRYIFAEFVRGSILALTAETPTQACDVVYGSARDNGAINNNQLSAQEMASFAEDTHGELYVIGLNSGIFRLDPGQ